MTQIQIFKVYDILDEHSDVAIYDTAGAALADVLDELDKLRTIIYDDGEYRIWMIENFDISPEYVIVGIDSSEDNVVYIATMNNARKVVEALRELGLNVP